MTDPSTNWWENFFHGIALDFWRAAVTDEQTRGEADFIQQQLQITTPARVLDVPCGGGRLAIELAGRGFDLTGVDIAWEFIDQARADSTAQALNIEWHSRDMRELPWREVFEAAFCFGNSFGYLDDEGNEQFLKALARTLKPGARLIIETGAIAESILPNFQPRRWFEVGSIKLLIDSRYDFKKGRIFTEYTFIRDGQTEKRPSSQRVYTCSQLGSLLADVGLEVRACLASLDGDVFQLGAERLFLVAQKTRAEAIP
jgi:SAM-dependent methyltransferase